MSDPIRRSGRVKNKIVRLLPTVDGDHLMIEHFTNGPFLIGEIHRKLTVVRARQIVTALMPYTEWTPEFYGKERQQGNP